MIQFLVQEAFLSRTSETCVRSSEPFASIHQVSPRTEIQFWCEIVFVHSKPFQRHWFLSSGSTTPLFREPTDCH